MEWLLSQYPHIDAVFAASDLIGLESVRVLAAEGLNVPDTVSVVGFDDIDAAGFTLPPLTTIRQDPVMMGRMAGRILLDRILERITSKSPQKVFLKPELVVRKSTAAV